MTLKAVLFDYGMVLSGPQDPAAHAQLLRLTGLPHEEFERHYWADRHAYDEGKLTGLEYWRNLTREAGLDLDGARIEELNAWDARMWTTENPSMLVWQQDLKSAGFQTAILSNMGDRVLQSVEENLLWIEHFDVLIWSYQHRLAKPDPAIYSLTLSRLQRKPQETLFLDDKPVNIDAARALGLQALLFTTVAQLRIDLIATNLEAEVPLPDPARTARNFRSPYCVHTATSSVLETKKTS